MTNYGKKIYSKVKFNEFIKYYELNKQNLIESIKNEKYNPSIIKMEKNLSYEGNVKIIGILDLKDKFITKTIEQILEKHIKLTLSKNSFTYEQEKDFTDAMRIVKRYVEEENKMVCQIYIKDFYENINHDKLLKQLDKYEMETPVKILIKKYLKCEIDYNHITSIKNKGLIQENSMSSVLSNLYLDKLLKTMEKQEIKFIRFYDNINIFSKNKQELIKLLNYLEKQLKEEYFLEINKEKTKIDNIYNTIIFGYKIIKNKENVEIIKKEEKENKYYTYWKKNSLKKENNEYHIINDGILNQEEYSVLFENFDKKVYIPVESTGVINVYSDVIFGANFFKVMNINNIIVNIFDKKNTYIGKFIPNNTKKSSLTLLKQVENYNNTNYRLKLAKDIIFAEIHNLKSNLMYYNRRYDIKIDNEINKIKECERNIKKIDTHINLLLTEARIREIYYSCFTKILSNKQFKLTKRTKRPPKDPINCLISFANTLLYNFIAKEIYKTTLDIRVAYLHSTNNRYESLNLDLADIFKPIIVDRMIFKIVNKRIINDKIHFEEKNGGIYLNEEGKKIVIKEFYNKLLDKLTIKNMRINYESIIRKEIYKLLNAIRDNKEYKAFRYY